MAAANPISSLTDASAVGPGSTVDFATAKWQVTMVVIPSGTITAGQVLMEASVDGLNWIPQHQMTVMEGVNHGCNSVGGAFRYYRANIVAEVAGGGSVTVSFTEAG